MSVSSYVFSRTKLVFATLFCQHDILQFESLSEIYMERKAGTEQSKVLKDAFYGKKKQKQQQKKKRKVVSLSVYLSTNIVGNEHCLLLHVGIVEHLT